VKHGLVTLVVIMILKKTATVQVLFIVYSGLGTSLLWRSTVAFTNLNPPSAFVDFQWSWSYEFGLVYITGKSISKCGPFSIAAAALHIGR